MKVYTLKVEGMTCPHCEMIIEKELKTLFPELILVKADRNKKEVTLKVLQELDLNKVSKAIEKLGYKITETE
ncbi:heavy-metal-associated domain-containing protein [Thermodesulfobacterium sp. TA1]|uniref:heavy-metal-associated domain-containing protein n=1 Tax=Thermodesulfobacterium sp. TA1 TaxID=2234087 RepID=UPI001231CEFC|nr:heavy-metal-associated domain-containing protein [Thermodesulfobacterium sp. TA1]QER42811.1 heavy-metal-associated domain-containing protein [Thermodesulfobacterium sp. TA1]